MIEKDILTYKNRLGAVGFELNFTCYFNFYSDRFPYAGGDDNYTLFFEDPDRIKVEVACKI